MIGSNNWPKMVSHWVSCMFFVCIAMFFSIPLYAAQVLYYYLFLCVSWMGEYYYYSAFSLEGRIDLKGGHTLCLHVVAVFQNYFTGLPGLRACTQKNHAERTNYSNFIRGWQSKINNSRTVGTVGSILCLQLCDRCSTKLQSVFAIITRLRGILIRDDPIMENRQLQSAKVNVSRWPCANRIIYFTLLFMGHAPPRKSGRISCRKRIRPLASTVLEFYCFFLHLQLLTKYELFVFSSLFSDYCEGYKSAQQVIYINTT